MAATKEVKDFSADEFAEWLRGQCRGNNGEVDLDYKSMTDESLARLAEQSRHEKARLGTMRAAFADELEQALYLPMSP